jgi:hypothetical protein
MWKRMFKVAWPISLGLQPFHGDLRLVTAAYFVGENRMAARSLSYSSPEVYRYVSRVAQLYRRKRMEGIEQKR